MKEVEEIAYKESQKARKRQAKKIPEGLQEIYDKVSGFDQKAKNLIRDAYFFAQEAHEGQLRKSGEPYFIHLVATAKNLADLGMDAKVIAAGILHDSIEDGVATEEQLLYEFGEEILFLVDGVTKLGRVRYQGMRRHNESLRKLFVATSRDVRVLIIKFADRLHNMSTLEHVREDKRERIATETLEIYAPLAYRLGITKLSKQLEDLSFPYVYPEEYKNVREVLKERSKQTIAKLERMDRSISKKLAANGMRKFRTTNRIKGTYSFFKKLDRKKGDADKIYDIAALRIIVPTVADCYSVLGIVHQNYRPMVGRIKDYIAVPKPNGYRSIHTTVFTGDGGLVELQIRTEAMHLDAELGAASHLGYKKREGGDDNVDSWAVRLMGRFGGSTPAGNAPLKNPKEVAPGWVDSLADHSDNPESESFQTELKDDFFGHQIFVFTPLGEVIVLPEGATPVDFAFQVHSEVGNRMCGAKVNEKMVSLDSELNNGDIIEILTSKQGKPNIKWLDFVKTNEARRKIRSFIEREEAEKR